MECRLFRNKKKDFFITLRIFHTTLDAWFKVRRGVLTQGSSLKTDLPPNWFHRSFRWHFTLKTWTFNLWFPLLFQCTPISANRPDTISIWSWTNIIKFLMLVAECVVTNRTRLRIICKYFYIDMENMLYFRFSLKKNYSTAAVRCQQMKTSNA